MYTKYNCCAGALPPRTAAPITNTYRIDNTQPGAIPESIRVSKWNCSTAVVSVPNVAAYQSSSTVLENGTAKVNVPVPSGSPAPLVTVQNKPASRTVAQRVSELALNQSDPYNPETRFAAYFPPAPMPYICPERIPNNDTKPSTADCLPIRRFQGSAEAAGLVPPR